MLYAASRLVLALAICGALAGLVYLTEYSAVFGAYLIGASVAAFATGAPLEGVRQAVEKLDEIAEKV